MSFSRVPQQFMKGIFITPHNFSDPQKPTHGEYVHMQLRSDLYFSAINQISRIQFATLSKQQDWIKVQQITQCKGEDPLYGVGTWLKQKTGRVPTQSDDTTIQVLSCQDWRIKLHDGQSDEVKFEGSYRVKVLQSSTDFFRAQIYPPTFSKLIKDLLVN